MKTAKRNVAAQSAIIHYFCNVSIGTKKCAFDLHKKGREK